MNNVCSYCLNYEPKKKKDANIKTQENCSHACFSLNKDEKIMVCQNFSFVIAPAISSAVVERYLKKDINFYDNLCDLASIILTMFSFQTIFKIVFDIEHGEVELIDISNSSNTYGTFHFDSIELKKGYLMFEANDEFRSLILGVIEENSLIFVEIKDFDHQYPIKGTFMRPNRFIKKNRLTLGIQSFSGQEVW